MSNDQQIEYWNGQAGERWVTYAGLLDAMLAGFARMVLNAADLKPGERVLDIGCGAGSLSLAAAPKVAAEGGEVVGVDVSAPLLALAKARADKAGVSAQFVEADASVWTSGTPFDVMISRYGVMFFDDPTAAFANIRLSMKADGRLAFACWQPFAENEWMLLPVLAALPLLKEPPEQPDPNAPGPFAFGDKDRLAGILSDAGWCDIVIEPWRGQIALPGDSVEATADFMLQLGALPRLIEAQGLEIGPVLEAVIAKLKTLASVDGKTSLEGATWHVTARA